MHQVTPYSIYLGHSGDVRNVDQLHQLGIRVVVDLAGNEPAVALPRELTYLRFPLVDGAGNPTWLLGLAVNTVASLIRGHVITLVFCSAGMSRTPAIAAAGLSVAQGLPMDEALRQVTANRPHDVSPVLWQEIRAFLATGN